MKNIIFIVASILAVSCSSKYQETVNSDDDYQIIPKPKELNIAKGRFLINSKTKIICVKSLAQEAGYLSKILNTTLGVDLTIDSSANKNGNIKLELNHTIANREGYTLSVEYDAIIISGKTATGIFYGIQSLLQLLPIEIENGDNDAILCAPDSILSQLYVSGNFFSYISWLAWILFCANQAWE